MNPASNTFGLGLPSPKAHLPQHRKGLLKKPLALPGPKSGTSLKLMCLIVSLKETSGVRVPPAATTGGGLTTAPAAVGKHRGPAQTTASATQTLPQSLPNILKTAKRAYRRARNRAHASAGQGTWYRGRRHTTASLGRLPPPEAPSIPIARSKTARRKPPSRSPRHLQVFSWNTGGLSGPMFQELLAWCELNATLDAIVLQETHWSETGDFTSGPWLAMHSSGRNSTDGHGKSAGLLFLLRRSTFQDPRIREISPGRLALVQATIKCTGLPFSLIGIYQHVWRTHLTSTQNRDLRDTIWQALENTVQTIPVRHNLAICGDLNSTLSPENPIAGPAATTSSTNQDPTLNNLMRRQSLTATNTWHCKPHHTYYTTNSTSQIDFILVRQRAATHRAKYASPLHSFPVGAARLNGHYPIHAQLPIHHYHQQRPSSHAESAHDSTALQQAVRSHTPVAQELQCNVQARLREVDLTNLLSAHNHVNRILLEETRRLFPPTVTPDHRVSAHPGFRTQARHTWELYRRLKHSGVCTFRNIFAKWRLAAEFAQASRHLRQQSKIHKKAYYESQVELAEEAAARGDQRSLHLIVRRLSPKDRKIASRLRGQDGTLLSRAGELKAIVQHSNQTFAVHADDAPLVALGADFCISDIAIATELSRLGPAKAVPKHIAPSATWKLCATAIGHTLGAALRGHFQKGTAARLDSDWKDSYVVWIPKPNKPPVNVASLRPIGLTSPASKALAGSLRASLLEHLEPVLKVLPQFAYAKHRGTANGIAKAHHHFHQVDQLLQQTKASRFQQKSGLRNRQCAGGLCLSLDLSRAFDGVTRSHIYQAMHAHQVPQDLVTIVQQLHKDAQYKFQVGDLKGSTVSTNGIKQGCVIAPYLWNFFTITFLTILQKHRSSDWIQRILSLFADDVWGAWLISCKADLDSAIADVTLILATLEDLSMTINYSKTAILLKLTGKEASTLRRDYTFMKAGQPHLKLCVNGKECSVPIKEQHEYLGTIVTYRNRLERNMTHRIKACQHKYQGLRKLLNGAHHLSVAYRIRLWRACVCTSVFYSQHIVGVAPSTLRRLTTLLTRHLRAILRVPAHLTHVTNNAVWSQAKLPQPGWQLQQALLTHHQRLLDRHNIDPDITTTPQAFEFLNQQIQRPEDILLKEASSLVVESSALPPVNCPKCDRAFPTENAMRIHCSLQHKHLPQLQTKIPTTFDPATHAQAGMPACRLCSRQFFRWTHLKLHIESSACPALGGASHVRSPLTDAVPAEIQEPPTARLSIFEGKNVQHTPLVRRPAFIARSTCIEHWLAMPAVRQELKNHCALCHMWIASFRHVKQHFNRVHAAEHPDLLPRALTLCSAFKSHLRRNSNCIWCGHTVGAPQRHTQQCTPLVQLHLAHLHCQDVRGQGPPAERGSGDIRRLLGPHTGRVLPVRHSPSIAEEAPPRADTSLEPAASSATASLELRGPSTSSRPPTTSSASPARSAHPPQQSRLETRGDHQQVASRQDLRPLHAQRDQRHPWHPHEDRQGLAGQEKPGGGSAEISSQNGASGQHASRGDEPCPTSRCNGGGQDKAHPAGMAHPTGCLELPHLEPHGEETPNRSEQSSPAARGGHQTAHLPPPELEGRGDPTICRDETAEPPGAARSPGRHLSHRGVTARPSCPRALRDLGEADKLHLAEPHRGLDEEGQPPLHTDGKNTRRHGLPPTWTTTEARPPTITLKPAITLVPPLSNPSSAVAAPHTGDDAEYPHSPLPNIRLQGGNNSCYLNSFLYGLHAALTHCGMSDLRHKVFGQSSGTLQQASRLIGFNLLGWPAPRQQHDVAELIDYLHIKLASSALSGRWESRGLTAEGLDVHSLTTAHRCMRLPYDADNPSPYVQDSIHLWHHQLQLQGLSAPPETPLWLFLQLPRFQYRAGVGAEKLQQAYILPSTLTIPLFPNPDTLNVTWTEFTVVAHIQHHGATPASGHYTTVVPYRGHYWLLDDEKAPQRLTVEQLDHVSTNVYVIVIAAASTVRAAVATPHSFQDQHVSRHEHVTGPAASNIERGRHQLGCEPHILDTDASSRPGGGNGGLTAGIHTPRLQGSSTRTATTPGTTASDESQQQQVLDSVERSTAAARMLSGNNG